MHQNIIITNIWICINEDYEDFLIMIKIKLIVYDIATIHNVIIKIFTITIMTTNMNMIQMMDTIKITNLTNIVFLKY